MKTILEFLQELTQNNTRDWFESHKDLYEAAKKEQIDFLNLLLPKISAFEPAYSHLQPKNCIFRIYRDIRFSKDKTPYKDHFGMYFEQGGKQSIKAGYYLHIQADNKSFLGGGMYMPDADSLRKIRQEIDYNREKFHQIIENADFVKYYGQLSEEQKLKKAPKGYPINHPDIEILKLKGFFTTHALTDDQVKKEDFADYASKVFEILKPLNDFLNEAVSS
jgi:uncharacterized protein (TIGR02453 family)